MHDKPRVTSEHAKEALQRIDADDDGGYDSIQSHYSVATIHMRLLETGLFIVEMIDIFTTLYS